MSTPIPAAPAGGIPRSPGVGPSGASAMPASPGPSTVQSSGKKHSFTEEVDKRGKRVVMYGTGGWGKTSIAAMAPGAGFIDLDRRTGHVAEKLTAHGLKLNRIKDLGMVGGRIDDAQAFQETRDVLHDEDLFPAGSTVVIDTATKLEEHSWGWVVKNVKHEKGYPINNIEDYGWGKGYTHAFDQMCKVLSDLDALSMRGVNSIMLCHDCIANFNDPAQVGQHKRYEPRLYRSASGNTDTRLRVREWADAVLFCTYDMIKEKDGVVTGQGTRKVYTQERPGFMAKSSLPPEQFEIPMANEFDGRIWELIFA